MPRRYKSSISSSIFKPHCLRISDRVPLANSEWIGTTVLKTCSPTLRSRETWLPFWRSSTNPARLSARISRSPKRSATWAYQRETSTVVQKDSDSGRRPSGTPQVSMYRLDGFTKAFAGTGDVFALRSNAKFRAPGDVPTVFFGYEGGEAVSHKAMLANLPVSSK
jgi:hypothetical protein